MVLLWLHLVFTIIASLACLVIMRSFQAAFIVFITVFMFPVGGWVCLLAYIFFRLMDKDADLDPEDLMIVGKSGYKFYKDLIVEDEVNVLPLSDVLRVSDKDIRRERFLETIKKDITGYSDQVKSALSNEDGETSHYAASILQESKRKMDGQVQELMGHVGAAPEDLNLLMSYADFLWVYIAFDFFQAQEKKRFVYDYIKTAKKIIKAKGDEKYLIQMIHLLLDYKEFAQAKTYGRYYLDNYQPSLPMYTINMKIFYTMKDTKNLNKTIDSLRASDLVYDSETLSKIRFWIGDEA